MLMYFKNWSMCWFFSSEVRFLYFVLHFGEPVVYIGFVPSEQGFVHGGVLGMRCMIFFKGWLFQIKSVFLFPSCLRSISKLEKIICMKVYSASVLCGFTFTSLCMTTSYLHILLSSVLLRWCFACCMLPWSPVSAACCATSRKSLKPVWCTSEMNQWSKMVDICMFRFGMIFFLVFFSSNCFSILILL